MNSFDFAHGLDEAGRQAMRQTLSGLSARTGFAYDRVFDALASGADLLSALNLPQGTAELLYAQAFARFNAGDLETARSLFLALTVIDRKRRDHWLGLGICLRQLEDLTGARAAFETAESLAPEDPAVLFHLTELFCSGRNWVEAEVYLRRFIALPESAARLRLIPDMRKLAAALEAQP